MTSFPAAAEYAEKAVRTILNGNVLPDKMVLYLTFSQFGKEGVPASLLRLQEENPLFEIRNYDRDIRSYRKLVPALSDFPDDVIVTVDDDVAYHPDMLAKLLRMHKKFPKEVIAHRAKTIRFDKPYKKWNKYRWYHFLTKKEHVSFRTLQTGVGGVLYPPGALKKEMLDPELFTQIAPTADDLWFWAAAVANGRHILPVPFGYNKPKGLGKPRELSLKWGNFKGGVDRNAATMNAILERYPLIRKQLEDEQ